MNINGKKISILGAVRSGIGAAKLAKKLGAFPFVSDESQFEKLEDSLRILSSNNIEFEFGAHSQRVYDCDFIITSPGVPSNSAVLQTASKKNIKVVTEVEFASWFCKGTIIAVTGTNGKTTTTSLMDYTLNNSGKKSFAAGNIGFAFSEIASEVNTDEFVTLETSSFQLDFMDTFKPKYAMMLNITPDHLDRYNNSFIEYTASKIKITGNLDENDIYIYNADEPNTISTVTNTRVRKFGFSLNKKLEDGAFLNDGILWFANHGIAEKVCLASDLFIKGEHNIANALAVLIAGKLIGITNNEIASAFTGFKGVEHRLEFVKEINGVDYINDSKATNVDSVWYALRSFQKPIYLILGGKDKGNNYDQIKELVEKNVAKIYAIGSSAQKVYDYFSSFKNVEIMNSLEECVSKARAEVLPESVLLLSPACASFDMFNNYEHRGEVFKEAVNKLNV